MAVPKVDQDDVAEIRQKFRNIPFCFRPCLEGYILCKRAHDLMSKYNIILLKICQSMLFILLLFGLLLFYHDFYLSKRPPLVVGVLSKRDNFMERLTIRNTWAVDVGQLHQETKLVFVLGETDCPIHPDLRTDRSTCKSNEYGTDRLEEWMNIVDYERDTYSVEGQNKCILGFGVKPLIDIKIRKANVDIEFIDENSKLWLINPGGSFNDRNPVELSLNEELFHIVLKGTEMEFVLEARESACNNWNNVRGHWSNGNNSVEYTYGRFADGSIIPWNESLYTPITIHFENREELCPTGWQIFKGYCYYYSKERFNWDAANEFCAAENSTLVSINSEEENNFIADLSCSGCSTWIGLEIEKGDIKWTWSDKTKVDYTNWGKYEPNNWNTHDHLCAEMVSYSTTWNDDVCYAKSNFVCKKKKVAKSVQTESTKSLNNKWNNHLKTVDERVKAEGKQFSDILLVSDLQDDYSSLPQKLKSLIKWTHSYHPRAWLFKTDDDTHVNVEKLYGIITQSINIHEPKASHPPAVFSHFHKLRDVPRFGKNAEYEYNSLTLQPFPTGAGYLMTDSVVEGLSVAGDSLKTLQGEDISVGLWLSTLNFKSPKSDHPLRSKIPDPMYYLYQILKQILQPILAQVTDDHSYSFKYPLYSEEQSYQPAELISLSCWVNSTIVTKPSCKSSVVTPDLSISDIVSVYNKQKHSED